MSDYKRDPFTVSNASGVIQPPSPMTTMRQENAALRAMLREVVEAWETMGNGSDPGGERRRATFRRARGLLDGHEK
jgi:hypothetical protein